MNQDLKDIREQKATLVKAMSKLAVDSKEYKEVIKRYKTLIETEEMIKEGRRSRGILTGLLKVGGFIVTALGVIFVPQSLADKAYQNNQDMKMADGQVWNLIGKNFGPKDNGSKSI